MVASDSSTTSYEQLLRDIEEPSDTDVLCGRGEASLNQHMGNKKFIKIIRLNLVRNLRRHSTFLQLCTPFKVCYDLGGNLPI